MARRRKFIIYRMNRRAGGIRIAPGSYLGLAIFLVNLGAFFVGLFNAIGVWNFLAQTPAIVLLVLSLGFYAYSLVKLTDYSKPDREI
ncbi:MAG: hypothetical protein WA989_12860 [Henriciella sp.]|uniref:hypothetical protein n=1 Tax=Henriciella sp. TaxID=1968823 RepID=UPI003C706C27